jgi:hypothetical protein
MTITPGAMLASKPAYASLVASRIPGSVLSGNTISVSQPVPALANIGSSLAGKYIQNDPSTPQNGGINITQGVTTQGPINTNGQPINAGALNNPTSCFNCWGNGYVPGISSGVWHPIGLSYSDNGNSFTPIGLNNLCLRYQLIKTACVGYPRCNWVYVPTDTLTYCP